MDSQDDASKYRNIVGCMKLQLVKLFYKKLVYNSSSSSAQDTIENVLEESGYRIVRLQEAILIRLMR